MSIAAYCIGGSDRVDAFFAGRIRAAEPPGYQMIEMFALAFGANVGFSIGWLAVSRLRR
jgi:hypothetical protein